MTELALKFSLKELPKYSELEEGNPHLQRLTKREVFCLDLHFAAMKASLL
jgi:hypothetical protein